MKLLWNSLAALALALPLGAAELSVNGAGASFPAPVYRVWTYNYGKSTGGKVEINYQSSGSGAGINQVKDGTVDFGGSDNPLTQQELEEAGLCQFPMLTGGVVVIVNLPGVKNGALKLDQAALADLFLGKITMWNDERIRALNPELKLPRLKVNVVHRADSSGTSFIFTNYLSRISKEWEEKVGCGPAVNWPVGIGGQKNPGVCNNVARIRGAIGYTEYTYAVETRLPMAILKNRAGKFVAPTPDTFKASAANADWENAPAFHMVLTDQPGDNSWPITGLTYILVRRNLSDAAKATAMFRYFDWCYTAGATSAAKLNYVPLTGPVLDKIRASWKQQVKVDGKPLTF